MVRVRCMSFRSLGEHRTSVRAFRKLLFRLFPHYPTFLHVVFLSKFLLCTQPSVDVYRKYSFLIVFHFDSIKYYLMYHIWLNMTTIVYFFNTVNLTHTRRIINSPNSLYFFYLLFIKIS